MEFRFSRRADLDLEEIALYIARDNSARAFTFAREIREHCHGLLMFPAAAPLRPELGEGMRLSVFRSYVILYAVDDDVLDIRRVVHGARNLANLD